jgi:hypothetical protein
MRGSVGFLKLSRLASPIAALWLLCANPAWAGGGGADAAGLWASLCGVAATFSIPCPQYPTYATAVPTPISPAAPIVVELAAWENLNPDSFRMVASDCIQEGILAGGIYCPQLAVNATNPPANSPISGILGLQPPSALASLTSLAFISNPAPMVPLTVTQNSDPNATSYVYAVAEGANGQPNTLDLFLENIGSAKSPGSVTVALPLAVLGKNATTENSVVATVNIPPVCILSVFCPATVTVNLGTGKNTYSAASLGINVNSFFGASAHWAKPHSIYEVQIPLLVNSQTDPFYFLGPPTWASLPQCPNGINQISGYCNAFSQTNPPNGFAPKFLSKTVIGMAPSAAPQCPGIPPGTTGQPGAACPPQTDPTMSPIPITFGFCASFSGNPAAAFFLAIGPNGATYVSSPVNPALSGAPYPACPTS